jgi:FixJ family two-component response regulator
VSQESVKLTLTLYLSHERHNSSAVVSGNGAGPHLRGDFMNHADLLVVDDDDATRTGLRELLANAGFSVDVARDGAEAMGKISSHDFRVVLLDVRLPKIGGMDILARCDDKRRPPKVVVMTGADTTEVMLDALRGHAYDFLAKPIEPSRLIEIVTRAFAAGSGVTTIEVISARADWVELLVPCTRDAADRIQSFVQQLETDLPAEMRDSLGIAFHELLLNGIEWGGSSIQRTECVSRVFEPAGCCSIGSQTLAWASISTTCPMQPFTAYPVSSLTTRFGARRDCALEGSVSC